MFVVFKSVFKSRYAKAICQVAKLFVAHRVDCALCHLKCNTIRLGVKLKHPLDHVGRSGKVNAFYYTCNFLYSEVGNYSLNVILGDLHIRVTKELCLQLFGKLIGIYCLEVKRYHFCRNTDRNVGFFSLIDNAYISGKLLANRCQSLRSACNLDLESKGVLCFRGVCVYIVLVQFPVNDEGEGVRGICRKLIERRDRLCNDLCKKIDVKLGIKCVVYLSSVYRYRLGEIDQINGEDLKQRRPVYRLDNILRYSLEVAMANENVHQLHVVDQSQDLLI